MEGATRPDGHDIHSVAENVKHTATEFGRKATEKMEETRQATALRLKDTAGTMHQRAEDVSKAAHKAADRVDAMGHYLDEHSVKDMLAGAQSVMSRHPGKTLLISLFAGILVGQAFRRRD